MPRPPALGPDYVGCVRSLLASPYWAGFDFKPARWLHLTGCPARTSWPWGARERVHTFDLVTYKEAIVASHCDVCGKGPGFGMSVSHSHRRTHRRWNPNVQTIRALVAPGTRRRVNVCTSCLKAGKVTRA
jgi:large subunit ribosomal protein L28